MQSDVDDWASHEAQPHGIPPATAHVLFMTISLTSFNHIVLNTHIPLNFWLFRTQVNLPLTDQNGANSSRSDCGLIPIAQQVSLVCSGYAAWLMLVSGSPAAIAQTAYDEALQNFKNELGSKGDVSWLNGQTTMAGILSVVGQARSNAFPDNSRWSKISEGLDAISSRIIYYGGVLDALSQHHPEYVSLAWGAIKFVLMVNEPRRVLEELC
jgi:hypothetical protein